MNQSAGWRSKASQTNRPNIRAASIALALRLLHPEFYRRSLEQFEAALEAERENGGA